MDSATHINLLLAHVVYNQFEKKRFGINTCKKDQDPRYIERLFDMTQYYEINKELDRAMIVYFGETKTKFDLEQEIEYNYCPKAVELINAL